MVASSLLYVQSPTREPPGFRLHRRPRRLPIAEAKSSAVKSAAGVHRLGGDAARPVSALRLLHDLLRRVHRIVRRVRAPTRGQGKHEYARQPDGTHN